MKNYIKQNKDQVREQAQATSIAVKRTSSLEDVDWVFPSPLKWRMWWLLNLDLWQKSWTRKVTIEVKLRWVLSPREQAFCFQQNMILAEAICRRQPYSIGYCLRHVLFVITQFTCNRIRLALCVWFAEIEETFMESFWNQGRKSWERFLNQFLVHITLFHFQILLVELQREEFVCKREEKRERVLLLCIES